MARTIRTRTFLSAACLSAALVGPFALVGIYAATINSHAARIIHAAKPVQPTTAASRARTVSTVARESYNKAASVDDLMAAIPDPSALPAASAAESRSAQKTIVAQLDAFRGGDFKQADSYQAKSLRAGFPSTQQFRIAISQVYPEFTAYKSVQFGTDRADKSGRFVLVPTTLTGQDGITVQALYVMVRQPDATAVQSGASAPEYQVMTVLGGMNPHPILDGGMDFQVT